MHRQKMRQESGVQSQVYLKNWMLEFDDPAALVLEAHAAPSVIADLDQQLFEI